MFESSVLLVKISDRAAPFLLGLPLAAEIPGHNTGMATLKLEE